MSDIPTSERLARALEAENDPQLADMIALAREGYYDDYKSPLAAPITALVINLEARGHHDLAAKVRAGEFDSPLEEGQAWLNGPEGQEAIRNLLGHSLPN